VLDTEDVLVFKALGLTTESACLNSDTKAQQGELV
jgi:hypothetical protein